MIRARARSIRAAVAMTAVLAATTALMLSCATKAAAPAPNAASAQAAQPPAAATAPPASALPTTAAPSVPAPAAPEVRPEPSMSAPVSEKPEISLPRRSPMPENLIVASLHEPVPPVPAKPAAPAPANAAPPLAAPSAPTPAPKAVAAPAAPAAAPAPVAKAPKPAPAKPAPPPKAPAPAAKVLEPEPKNAASAQAIALDPAQTSQGAITRRMTAVVGTRFEVPFEGTGWTYLGETSAKPGIGYDSRRFVGSSLVFVLNPIMAGDYVLRFQRQDTLRGISYEDLVSVAVAPKPAAISPSPAAPVTSAEPSTKANGVAASSSAQVASVALPPVASASPGTGLSAAAPGGVALAGAVAPAAMPTGAAPATPTASGPAATQAGATTTYAAVPVSSLTTPEAALAQARSAVAAGQAQGALDALDRLIALAPAGTDEACLLYGQALELNGPTKDIKRAYSYYKRLRDDYPESAFWDAADERASYIERHYFDIR